MLLGIFCKFCAVIIHKICSVGFIVVPFIAFIVAYAAIGFLAEVGCIGCSVLQFVGTIHNTGIAAAEYVTHIAQLIGTQDTFFCTYLATVNVNTCLSEYHTFGMHVMSTISVT